MQRYRKLIKFIASAIILFMVGACTGNFDELNTNPTLLTEAKIQPAVLFTSVLKNSIFASYGDTQGRIGEFSQYYASQASGNLFTPNNYSSPFNWYRSYVINVKEVIRLTANDPQKTDQNAMARIWKAWVYHMLTDAYGDIPYFEAAQDVSNVINQPKYDTQEAIYRDMLNELKEASAQLGSQANQLSFGNADILYGGNVDKWKKFANSLRLRLAIRARFADATLAAEHINDVVNGNDLIEENADNAALKTLQPSATQNSGNVNFVYNYHTTNITPMFVGFGITDVMIPTNDPRMMIFFNPAIKNPNTYRGRPLQLAQEQKVPYDQDTVASVGPILKAPIYEIIVMNAAEVDFLKAEAAFANIITQDANTLYRSGIRKSMEQYGVAQTDITTFLNQDVGNLTGTDEEKFEKIATQKYIAMFFQGHQGWAEMRRTGYPKIWLGGEVGNAVSYIPRRFTYPDDEYQKNEANVKEAADRLNGGDRLDSRIWWDKRPGLPFVHPKQNQFPPN